MEELIIKEANEIDEETGEVCEYLYLLEPSVNEKIAELEKAAKKIKEAQDDIKAKIKNEMKAKGIKKITTDLVEITYIEETTRETLNSKALKAECPDIYDAYSNISNVADSVRIKIK